MKVQIIIGSTRPGRTSERMAKWVEKQAVTMENIEVEVVDLLEYPLPMFDEPRSPRYNPNRTLSDSVKKWVDKISEGDAYVFITPEYNHSIPGVLKNALDYITFEMIRKPATVVSHGTVGGARATMHLKEILSESGAGIIPKQIALASMTEKLDEDGQLSEELLDNPYGPQASLKAMLDELIWYANALLVARSNT